MFGFGKKKVVISSAITQDAVIHGSIDFKGGMRIDGTVEGYVTASGDNSFLSVAPNGLIKGNITAYKVEIEGLVHGSIEAEHVVMRKNGKVIGNVHYGRIQMEEGSCVQGQLTPMEVPQEISDIMDAPSAGLVPA